MSRKHQTMKHTDTQPHSLAGILTSTGACACLPAIVVFLFASRYPPAGGGLRAVKAGHAPTPPGIPAAVITGRYNAFHK